MAPMDLAAFDDAPYTDEAGERVRRRIEDEIYGRSTAGAVTGA
jgi:hypothetical protein